MKKRSLKVLGMILSLMLFCTGLYGAEYKEANADNPLGDSIFSQQEDSGFGAGSGNVGVSGQAMYTYPMGTVQAVYNSETGWQVGAASMISRSTRWGVPGYTNINFHWDYDIYTLNGMEMVYKFNDFAYHTEKESYLRIQYKNNLAYYEKISGTSYWEVTGKDGTVSKYGATADSRIEGIGRLNNQPRAWAISETRDVYSNLTKYSYIEDTVDGGCYLQKVVKGKANGSGNGYQATVLHYEAEPATNFNMRQGSRVGDNRRVKAVVEVIGCDVNGNGGKVVRAHKIGWVLSAFSRTSLIGSITKYGTNAVVSGNGDISGSSLQPMTFEYAQAQTGGFSTTVDVWANDFGCIEDGEAWNYRTLNKLWYEAPLGDAADIISIAKYKQTQYMMDMNGDGLPDVVYVNNANMSVGTNNGHGFGPLTPWINGAASFDAIVNYMNYWHDAGVGRYLEGAQVPKGNEVDGLGNKLPTDPQKQQVFTMNRLMDVNGDGLPDLVHQNDGVVLGKRDNGNLNDDDGNVRVQLNSGNGFGLEQNWGTGGFPWSHLGETQFDDVVEIIQKLGRRTSSSVTHIDFYDINGDGLPDRVADYDASSRNIDISLNNGNGFNGGSCFGYLPDARGGFMNYLRKTDSDVIDWGSTTKQEIVDINGDGLPDKIHCEDANFYVMLNNGHGYEPTVPWSNPGWGAIRRSSVSSDTNNTYITQDIIDMNGDGLFDLVKVNNGTIQVAFNNGSGFNQANPWGSANGNYLTWIDSSLHSVVHSVVGHQAGVNVRFTKTKSTLIDMNGDGLPDKVWIDSGILKVALNNASAFPDRMLVKVKNGMGGSTEYSYKPVNKQNNAGYKFRSWAVEKVIAKDGLGVSLTNSYDYSGGLYDSTTRENRGFRKVVQTGPTGNRTETYYFQDAVKAGLVEKVVVRDARSNIQSYSYNTYEDYATKPGHYGYGVTTARKNFGPAVSVKAPKLVQVDSYLVGGTTSVDSGTQPGGSDWKRIKKTMIYSIYGEPRIVKNYGEVNADGTDKGSDWSQADYTYSEDSSRWWIQPVGEVVAGALGSRQTSSSYDAVTGRLTGVQIGREIHGISVSCTYDSYGNINHITGPMDKTIEYDGIYHAYPVVVKELSSALMLLSTNQYDALMRVTNVVDYNGVSTLVTYDAFGRTASVVKAGDTLTYPTAQMVYQMDGTAPECVMGIQRLVSGQAQALTNYSYMDGLGRTVQTKQQWTNSNQWMTGESWSYIGGLYSGVNLVYANIAESRTPYLTSSSTFSRNTSPTGERTISKSYIDPVYGAKQEVIYPDGTTNQSFSMQFKSAVVNEKGYWAEEERDGLGNVIESKVYSSVFPAKTLYRVDEMYYDGAGGMLKKVEDYDGRQIVSSNQYDIGGQVISTWNPDRGTESYGYDGRGNIYSVSNVKGTTFYSRDESGRVQRETRPDGTVVNYYYHQSGASFAYGRGRLTSVADPSGSTEYVYDARGRIVEEKKTISGAGSAVMRYTYDVMDRVTTISYPDGEVVTNSYDIAGNLVKMGSIAQPGKYLSSVIFNEKGQVLEIGYGNGTVNNYSYYGAEKNYQLTNMKVKQIDGMESLNQSYSYDVSGNITAIDAGSITANQNFSYDFLNRLIGQNNGNYTGGASSFTYDAVDNMLSKNGVNYYYDSTKPHAVTGTSKNEVIFQYDAAGNMVRKGLNLGDIDVENLKIAADSGQLTLSWVNPVSGASLKSMRIVRKTEGYPGNAFDGTTVYSGMYNAGMTSVTDTGLANGTTYYYKVFLGDAYGNYSIGAAVSGSPVIVEYPWGNNEYGTLATDIKWTSVFDGGLENEYAGYEFTPLTDGKITKLGVLYDGTNYMCHGNLKIIDNTTGEALLWAYLPDNLSPANSWYYTNISNINVSANKTYRVILIGNLYQRGKFSQRSGISLPQTFGNIRITKSFLIKTGWINSQWRGVTNESTTTMTGQVDIGFVPNSVSAQPSVFIKAKGSICQGVWPVMQVYLDGQFVKQWNVNTPDYKVYTIPSLNTSGGTNLRVAFVNDAYAAPEDRNLWVDYVNIGGNFIQSEDSRVVYALSGGGTKAGQEYVNSAGELDFPIKGDGLKGEYYSNVNLTVLKATRTDRQVNFNWGSGAPFTAIGPNNYGVRWSGQAEALYNETYTFYTTSDDGVRLWVNGQKTIDNWAPHAATENSGIINLEAGKKYDVVMEYYQNSGPSVCALSWSSASQAKQIIPQRQLYSAREVKPGSINFTGANLAGYWKMNEGSGSIIIDGSRNTNKGQVSAVEWVNGVEGKAITFNGLDSILNFGSAAALNIAGNISIEAWVKTDRDGYIVSKGNGYAFRIYNGTLAFYDGHNWSWLSGYTRYGSINVSDNNWHHVVVTGEGTVGRFYIDGTLDAAFTFGGIPDNSAYPFYIGSIGVASINTLNGAIDEAAVWKKALTASEVQSRYRSYTGNSQTVMTYNMDDGSAILVKDMSGNGNNGNINGALFKQGKGVYASSAYEFSWARQDSIVAPYNASQTATNELTLEAWIYPTAWDNIYAGYNRIISKQPIYILRGANGYANFVVLTKNHGYQQIFSASQLALNQWHYLSGTFDGKKVCLYVNGVLQGTIGLSEKDTLVDNELSVSMGESGMLNEGFTGLIDNAAVYKRARTAQEVADTYNQLRDDGRMICWKMNEGSGNVVYSFGRSDGTGGISGAQWTTAGKEGSCLSFDGVDDYVGINYPGGAPYNNFSMEAWVKASQKHEIDTENNYDTGGVSGQKYLFGADHGGDYNAGVGVSLGTNGISVYEHGSGYMPALAVYSGKVGTEWAHIVVTVSNQVPRIYLNGTLVRTGMKSARVYSVAPTKMGSGSYGAFQGLVDGAVVYNRALSEGEIVSRYKGLREDAGNYPSYNYTYDSLGQLIGVSGDTTASYTYDFAGRRVVKIEGNSTNYSFSPYYEVENGKVVKHYYAGGSLIADSIDGQQIYYHTDHLGSTTRLSGAAGMEIKRMGYQPYGETASISGSGLTPKYQYTGQEKDATGLYYYGVRFYDSDLGRFLSLDPLGDNYVYCNNNPIMYNDPTGMSPFNKSSSIGGSGNSWMTADSSFFSIGMRGKENNLDYGWLNGMLNAGNSGCVPYEIPAFKGGYDAAPEWAHSSSGGYDAAPEWAHSSSGGYDAVPEWAHSSSGGYDETPDEFKLGPWFSENTGNESGLEAQKAISGLRRLRNYKLSSKRREISEEAKQTLLNSEKTWKDSDTFNLAAWNLYNERGGNVVSVWTAKIQLKRLNLEISEKEARRQFIDKAFFDEGNFDIGIRERIKMMNANPIKRGIQDLRDLLKRIGG
jgi:RHS repeat-associated protein